MSVGMSRLFKFDNKAGFERHIILAVIGKDMTAYKIVDNDI